MKKQFLFLLALLFVSQFMVAQVTDETEVYYLESGRTRAQDEPFLNAYKDTFQPCDLQYFSVIKLKIKRPEAIPFTINAKGGKVEFSTGNLQFQATTGTFRFATRQWEFVGNGRDSSGYSSNSVKWDSMVVVDDVDGEGNPIKVVEHHYVNSNNNLIGNKYGGWIDLFGWGTSGYNINKLPGAAGSDPYSICTNPYSTSYATVNKTYNEYGYGPSYNWRTSTRSNNIDTTKDSTRYYDWGQYNSIYCKWVGYDTTKAYGNTGKDSIVFDSTMFNAKIWRTLTDTEWQYLLYTRKIENRQKLPWAFINIQPGVGTELPGNGGSDPLAPVIEAKGLLIFPDEFELREAYKLGFNPTEADKIAYGTTGTNLTEKTLSYKSFIALEKLGVIFLPLSSRRSGTAVNALGTDGNYWTATARSAANAGYCVVKGLNRTTGISTRVQENGGSRYLGCCVRLVHDLDIMQEKLVSIYQ